MQRGTHEVAMTGAQSVSHPIYPRNLAAAVLFSLGIWPAQIDEVRLHGIKGTNQYLIVLIKTMSDSVKSLPHRGEVQVPELSK